MAIQTRYSVQYECVQFAVVSVQCQVFSVNCVVYGGKFVVCSVIATKESKWRYSSTPFAQTEQNRKFFL